MTEAYPIFVTDGIANEDLARIVKIMEPFALTKREQNSLFRCSVHVDRRADSNRRDRLRSDIILYWEQKPMQEGGVRQEVLTRLEREIGTHVLQIFEKTDDGLFGPARGKRGAPPSGLLFAINGTEGWIYYAQAPQYRDEEVLGLLKVRSKALLPTDTVLQAPVMGRVRIFPQDIWPLVRRGAWKMLGVYPPIPPLDQRTPLFTKVRDLPGADENRVSIVREPDDGEALNWMGLYEIKETT